MKSLVGDWGQSPQGLIQKNFYSNALGDVIGGAGDGDGDGEGDGEGEIASLFRLLRYI